MNSAKSMFFILLVVLLFTCGKVGSATEMEKRFILIIVPDFSFQEVEWLNENGEKYNLWRTGGMAAMNVRSDGHYSYLNSIVSISSGARGLGVEGWNAFIKGEKINGVLVEEVYQQYTGNFVEEGMIFHPFLHKLVDKNKNTTYRGEIGVLGQTLKDYQVKRFVIGNSDFGEEKIRYGSLLTMDQDGLTEGVLLEATSKEVGAAAGLVMDTDKIISLLSVINDRVGNSFTVIEWGDLARLMKQKVNMTPDYYHEQYERTLLRLESSVDKILKEGYSQQLLLLSPSVHNDAYQNKEMLAPIFSWDGDLVNESFYLESETTRQRFLVSNLDIVPTILAFYDIDEKNDNRFFGKPLLKKKVDNPVLEEALTNINFMFQVFKTRNLVLSSYITLLVILLVLVSLIIVIKSKKTAWKHIAKVLLISGISSPMWLLVTPYLLLYINPPSYLILLNICSFLTGYFVVKYIPKKAVFILCSALFTMITVDLLLGNFFMQRSYLGYDPIIGARYYGIGNEFAGVYLISGLLLLETTIMRRWIVLATISIAMITLLSSANLGANAGATISAGVMFGFFSYRNFFPNLRWKTLLILFGLLISAVVAILFLAQLNGNESHIGYAFTKLFQGDLVYITDTIKRKLAMNWKIFRFSNWTQLFVTTYLLIGVYLWRGKAIVQDKTKRLLIQTGVLTSIALLLLNDSGVVAAATSMFIIVCASYYWALAD
ncbi:hypothetical protein RJD24_21425 [Bacillaceae bacterium IKA-2]|nr:hypothetical protein RJD24_21425 [Bacillaceae bacterium IKA-2]